MVRKRGSPPSVGTASTLSSDADDQIAGGSPNERVWPNVVVAQAGIDNTVELNLVNREQFFGGSGNDGNEETEPVSVTWGNLARRERWRNPFQQTLQVTGLDNAHVANRAMKFLQLCRKPFCYRRVRDHAEHVQAWQEVREDLDSIKKDNFLATFVARFQDEEKSTALHYMCRARPPIYVVEALLEVSGQTLKRRDKGGNLPLHLAAQYGASYDVVQAVLHQYPEGADIKNRAGRLPILLALMSSAQPKIVEILKRSTASSHLEEIDEYSKKWQSFRMIQQHHQGQSRYSRPLSVWMAYQNALVALTNNEEYPLMAEWIIERIDDDEDTLLHNACCLHPPVHLIQMMIGISRNPLRMRNAWGGLPLHYAVLRGAPASITILLCQEYPPAIRARDDFGSLPLHYALRNGATFAVIEVLLDAFPEACGLKDNNGHLPLHVAAISGVSDAVLERIVHTYPKATRSRDNNGSLPVHHAIKRFSTGHAIKILEKADAVEEETFRRAKEFLEMCDVYKIVKHRKAARRSTTFGDEEPQLGIWSEVRDEIETLCQDSIQAEEIASHCDEYGNTPLHIVCMSRPPVDVVKSLVKMSRMPLLNHKNENDWLPLHVAIRYGASYDVVKALLDACPESCKVRNEHGKLPFRMAVELNASEEVKQILFESDVALSKEIEYMSWRARAFRRQCTISRHESKQHSQDYDAVKTWKAVRDAASELKQEGTIGTRVAEYPDKETGMTPLHIVCGSPDTPPDVVELLLSLSVEPLRMRSKRERLPLHIALDNGATDDVLELLLRGHPDDTKKEDLNDESVRSLRTLVISGASVEVIQLLADASPVPVSEDGISLFESLKLDRSNRSATYPVEAMNVFSQGRNRKHLSPPEIKEDLIESAKAKVRISEDKMNVLIHSFLGQYQIHELGDRNETDHETEHDTDNVELPLVGRLLLIQRASLMGGKNREQAERDLICDRFFSFLRTLPTNLKEEALFHPGLQDMLNKMIARRFFTCILMADFFTLIAVIVTLNFAVIPDWDRDENAARANDLDLAVLVFCTFYLILREMIQILSYCADHIFKLWYKDPWNWLDVSYIALLVASTSELRKSQGIDSDAAKLLLMITGGLSWLMLLVELKSTALEFSVFTSGLLNIAKKLIPFLITSLILLEAFAFMFFVDAQRSGVDRDCPATEMVGLESGGHEEVEVHEPNFCTFRDTQLKVFTMMVSIEQNDFVGGGVAKVLLAVVFAYLFVVILLNVLIAIVNENWEDVQRDGKAVFWQARYDFVSEVDALGSWSTSIFDWLKNVRRGNVRTKGRLPGWFNVWLTVRSWFLGFVGWIGYVLWLLAGLLSLGVLWDDSFREWLLCRKPTAGAQTLSNEMLQEALKASHEEMGAKMDGMREEMKQEMDILKKHLFMLLEEHRGQQQQPVAESSPSSLAPAPPVLQEQAPHYTARGG